MSHFSYNPTLSGMENLNIILRDVGIPDEMLDNVEIEAVKDAKSTEFDLYPNKVGNTALKIAFSGELAQLLKRTTHVYFYDRTLPIPDKWKDRIMYVRDSELKNLDIGQYIKNRWIQDGYPFVGESLSFDVQGTAGNLNYGRNIVDVRASVRSYGLAGVAKQRVQYFVDLNDKVAKVITTVNPFLTSASMTKRNCYIELALPPGISVKDTERKILERYLKEAYGLSRGKAVIQEIDAESLSMVRSPTFREEIRNPQTKEQEYEAKAAKDFVHSYLYTLSENQEEDGLSKVVGNIRLMVGKSNLAKLVLDSNRFPIEEDQAFRFQQDRVRSFILSKTEDNFVEFEIALGKYTTANEVSDKIKSLIPSFFGEYAKHIDVVRESTESETMAMLVTPSAATLDYIGGEIKVKVNWIKGEPTIDTDCPCDNTEPGETDPVKKILRRNLNGFSAVSITQP